MNRGTRHIEPLLPTAILVRTYPNADITATGWVGHPTATLWDKLDETVPDDADYIDSTTT